MSKSNGNGKAKDERPKRVIWAVPLERHLQNECVVALMDVAQRAGQLGYDRISLTYARTDAARAKIAALFMQMTADDARDDDTLIMLDDDHKHPANILERLASHSVPVVGALAVKRGEVPEPCFFRFSDDGQLHAAALFEQDTYQCDAIGHAAIAIQRCVFEKLGAESYPWWRYEYHDGHEVMPSEDMYFSRLLREAGIPIYCDTSIVTPHAKTDWADDESWRKWIAAHPEFVMQVKADG